MIKDPVKFCCYCGARVNQLIPEGDSRLRDVCGQCGAVHYQNPHIVTGCLPVYKDKVLLCKRAIEPRSGYWTLPGGFMELGETMAEGAVRETREEACATVVIRSLYTVFDVVHADQVSVFFLAELEQPEFAPGPESEDVRLFSQNEIPWDELAFSTITDTLNFYYADHDSGAFPLHQKRAQPVRRR